MNETTHIAQPTNQNPVNQTPEPLTVQWSSNGEARISLEDRNFIDDAVESGNYDVFPAHGSFGTMHVGLDNTTLWLYTGGGSFVAGDLVPKSQARAKSMPASGVVDISKLDPSLQDAVMKLLGAKK